MAAKKFTIEIELGNDAMQTGEDVAEALQRVAGLVGNWGMLFPGGRPVLDTNGNRVGQWLLS